jgi:GDPmannose 4,6-dehydratase
MRDWGFAGDFVEAMYLMLQQDKPDDYVVSTGTAYSVKDLLTEAFTQVGLNWQDYVEIDPRYFRPTEVDNLQGDCTKAKTQLGWTPKTDFKTLVKMMVDHDMELAAQEAHLEKGGFKSAARGQAAA